MWVFSDFLRKYWKQILTVILLLFILIINVRLFIIAIIIVTIVYMVVRLRRGRDRSREAQRVRLGVIHEITREDHIKEGRVCINVGLGRSIAIIGNRWVTMLSLDYVDTSIINELMELCDVLMGNGRYYLLIHGNDPNDVVIRLGTITKLLSSRGLTFRQLSPSEVINEVVGVWMK
ncbi:hypothetical protein [Vulcanisaeta thermophila]|uniref:hypothetical protein n=1 Tax=Vulcanisaeta thermophila TaxID=867917 RepID=UPI0008532D74|nr:hypothetical protein [Vulcanisaeta thermophila]